MRAEIVAFAAPKFGSAPHEWEDGVGFDEGYSQGQARLVVVDGATEAFDVLRWVDLLVGSFLPPVGQRAPQLNIEDMTAWFEFMQGLWEQEAPQFSSPYAETKFRTTGAFATFLGCELRHLETGQPRWRAVSIGDAILFHIRDWTIKTTFPAYGAGDFNNQPPLVYTDPQRIPEMAEALEFGEGTLVGGDLLIVATDALAHWVIKTASSDEVTLCRVLATIGNDAFQRLVEERRRAGELKNDDVTLVRVTICEDSVRFGRRR